MATHIIQGGVVINTIVASIAEAQSAYPDAVCIPADTGSIGWLWDSGSLTPPPLPEAPEPTQFERDQARYTKRAAVKDSLLAYMAADNMSRVRSGVWTVTDLTSLLANPAVSAANQFMSTLSFELAAQAISQSTSPLLTPAIKADWVSRLQQHFYLVP